MDSSGGQEKSLPGMGMPRWMKKTTERCYFKELRIFHFSPKPWLIQLILFLQYMSSRYNYADICASPPSNEDGFLHISRHRTQPPASNVNSDAQGNGKYKSLTVTDMPCTNLLLQQSVEYVWSVSLSYWILISSQPNSRFSFSVEFRENVSFSSTTISN